jgi:hypothetical protein
MRGRRKPDHSESMIHAVGRTTVSEERVYGSVRMLRRMKPEFTLYDSAILNPMFTLGFRD